MSSTGWIQTNGTNSVLTFLPRGDVCKGAMVALGPLGKNLSAEGKRREMFPESTSGGWVDHSHKISTCSNMFAIPAIYSFLRSLYIAHWTKGWAKIPARSGSGQMKTGPGSIELQSSRGLQAPPPEAFWSVLRGVAPSLPPYDLSRFHPTKSGLNNTLNYFLLFIKQLQEHWMMGGNNRQLWLKWNKKFTS